jgi:hypothetical protein
MAYLFLSTPFFSRPIIMEQISQSRPFLFLFTYLVLTVILLLAFKTIAHKSPEAVITSETIRYKRDIFYGWVWTWDYKEHRGKYFITNLKVQCKMDNQNLSFSGNGFKCPLCKRQYQSFTGNNYLSVFDQLELTKFLIIKQLTNERL